MHKLKGRYIEKIEEEENKLRLSEIMQTFITWHHVYLKSRS
jgi:hypothetical protein